MLDMSSKLAIENCAKTQQRYVDQYNKRSRDKTFEEGDSVLILMPDSSKKLMSRWQGPGIVTAKISENSYRVALDDGAIKILHANKLRKFVNRVNSI